ncbi:hypothetical protein [Bifidobacterium olomucense]|uniref:Uncharacterized protein n=1 Tax=Bifidobacterium olomucense TaxID=2675324 RepID=A0A7Y0HWH5_9BIFI|nr:hypothetical protein [Bifidobacterium sp. DSM 109959]NMM99240.1 hypothetical protein [Bifidobacterium sp. DSM 109959]
MSRSEDENYDFFGDEQYDDVRRATRANGRSRSRRAVRPALKTSSPASRLFSRLAAVSGVLAVLVALASDVHEIAPDAVPAMTGVPGRYIALTAAVLIAVTVLMVITARATMPKYATHGGVGAGGIVALVAAMLCLTVGVAVGVLFPEGLIHQSNDKAPVDDTSQMEQGIEQAAGACTGGWQGLDTGGVPGVTTVQMCAEPRVAFVSFESPAAAAVGAPPMRSGIVSLLNQYSTDERAQGDWQLLSGERWMVFGENEAMTALQQQWGGTMEAMSASDASAAE